MSISLAQAETSAIEENANFVNNVGIVQIVSASNADKNWRPTDIEYKRVMNDVNAYFSAKDSSNYSAAYSQFSPSQKDAVSYEDWKSHMQVLKQKAGEIKERKLTKLTWYKDATNAPKGIFAAVDFKSDFTELSLHCGFVAMQLQSDGTFKVAREEENLISKKEISSLAPEAIKNIRQQFGC